MTDSGNAGGGGETGGGSAGGTAGGGQGGGTNQSDGGDGTWEFSSVTLSPPPPSSGKIVGFAEADAGVYAVSSSGRVYRSTGGPFVELFNFGPSTLVDFKASPTGHFFALSTTRLMACTSDCADAGSWSAHSIAGSNTYFETLCVISSDHVLAIGARNISDGVSHRWNGTTLGANGSPLGVTSPVTCWRSASGEFFIPADETVMRYSPTTESFVPEPTGAGRVWSGGGSTVEHEWLLGMGIIAERRAPMWTNVFAPTEYTTSSFSAIVGVSPTLVFAFASGPSGTPVTFRFDGTLWKPLSPDVPVLKRPQVAFRSADGTIYVGGSDSSVVPAIVRGTRH